jgi:hypothetical protein
MGDVEGDKKEAKFPRLLGKVLDRSWTGNISYVPLQGRVGPQYSGDSVPGPR